MAKRGQNEDSISKRKDGRRVARFTVGYEGGKQKRKYIYGRTREEVAGKLAAALKAKRDGSPVSNDRITFRQFLDKWLEESVKPSVRPRTYDHYSQYVRLYIRPALGNIKLVKLSPENIQALFNRQVKKGLSARTAQLTHSCRPSSGSSYRVTWQPLSIRHGAHGLKQRRLPQNRPAHSSKQPKATVWRLSIPWPLHLASNAGKPWRSGGKTLILRLERSRFAILCKTFKAAAGICRNRKAETAAGLSASQLSLSSL